ncbi:Methylmalonyl-CoA epimerase, mitochondrial [Orchesella cincta]|uniref:Methylmalonyl-CoA epimerase, mitochondrial n=1 Tax=Orchesella cincta TaxID=48709 RepID=A0A1D2N2U0_ORCCI|nr:Methylmalonyl-CoA epimerase, mitochondrial [Orchesella cincta]
MFLNSTTRNLIPRALGLRIKLGQRITTTSYKMSSSASSSLKSDPVTAAALKLGRLNHVAIATPNLQQATMMYRDILGAIVSKAEDLPDHGVTTVFVELGNTKIELLHPLGDKSPIQNFLDKNKAGGIHHICIEVDDIYAAVESLKSSGKIRILDPKPKIGAHGKPVVFLHPKDCGGVLLELEQA